MYKEPESNPIISFFISIVVFIAATAVAIIPAYLIGELYKAVDNDDGALIAYGVFAVLFILCLFIFHSWAKRLKR